VADAARLVPHGRLAGHVMARHHAGLIMDQVVGFLLARQRPVELLFPQRPVLD
jgi:hypothetical protein